MSLLINSFKPNATMRLGSPLNEKTMLIAFDTNGVGGAPVTTTAVKLVEVNPEADTITYSTYPPDELTSINNLETSTALTIHQYDVTGHAERYGYHNQASSQQDPWRIWAYHDDTKLFRQTGSGAVTAWTTLAKYQKVDSYTPAIDETVFSNKAISIGMHDTYPSQVSHARGRTFMGAVRSKIGAVRYYTLHDNTTIQYQASALSAQTTTVVATKHTEQAFNIALVTNQQDFFTVQADKDICVYYSNAGNDLTICYPSSQEIFLPLDANPCVFIWDRSNPTSTSSVTLNVQYSDGTTNTVYNINARTQVLTTKQFYDGFARIFLAAGTSSDIVLNGRCYGDGAGNDQVGAVTGPQFLSTRLAIDNSVDNPQHIGPVIYGIQYSTGVDYLYMSDLILGFTGQGVLSNTVTLTATTVNTQADGVKLLVWNLPAAYPISTNFQKKEWKVDHTTTYIFGLFQKSTKEESYISGDLPLLQNVTPHAEDYTINSKTAIALNHTGISQTIGAHAIYDTTPYGISTLVVFSRNGTDVSRSWIKLSGHGVDSSYFSVGRYAAQDYICIQFRGTAYSDTSTQMIAFPFSTLSNASNHVVYASVRESSSESFDFHLELHSFTTSGTEALVDEKSFTVSIPYVENSSFLETDWMSGIDNTVGNQDDFSSITIAQVQYFKGNHTETDRDALIAGAITYWTT
jgi:hypothetical protein